VEGVNSDQIFWRKERTSFRSWRCVAEWEVCRSRMQRRGGSEWAKRRSRLKRGLKGRVVGVKGGLSSDEDDMVLVVLE
jgi:hypothetical protein